MNQLRLALAVAAVSGALLATGAMFMDATCTCGTSRLPYAAIALWSWIGAGSALAAYVATAVARRRT